jgi:protoporphyrinogen oxidase
MRWVSTRMGYFMEGKVHPWGDPLSLLLFPHIGLLSKIRTGLQMFLTTRTRDFGRIEHLTARQWLERGSGEEVYRVLWKRLLDLKFYQYADEVSASWIATRVKRTGRSRRSLFQEELGHIEGGTETLIEALVARISAQGGRIHLRCPAETVMTDNGRVIGVKAGGRIFEADAVLCTVPIPLVNRLVPDLPPESKLKYAAIRNIGVVCLIFKLRRSVSKNFWLNIVAPNIEIPGIIEFSNLRPTPDTIVYVPYYLPETHPKWQWTDDAFVAEAFGAIKRINPAIGDEDLIDVKVGRLRYAQPVCEPNFRAKIPDAVTPIAGLQVADTCYYYPEDRGLAESIRYGRNMVRAVTTTDAASP